MTTSLIETNIKSDDLHKIGVSCSLALVEAVNNAIFHAHKKDITKWIDLKFEVTDKAIVIEIFDTGDGFQVDAIHEPNLELSHGRGLFIIRSVMHEMKYTCGKKNKLQMTYYL